MPAGGQLAWSVEGAGGVRHLAVNARDRLGHRDRVAGGLSLCAGAALGDEPASRMIVAALDDADKQACEEQKCTYGSPRESYTCGTHPSAGARPTCGVPGVQRVSGSALVPGPLGGQRGRLDDLQT